MNLQPSLPIEEIRSDAIRRSADFSPCRTWRYTLKRFWSETRPHVLFIMLNPSTADERHDDPTNRRCIDFARRWGYGGVVHCNLFAYRSADPSEMMSAPDPVGPDNDSWLISEADAAGFLVFGWGTLGGHLGRDLHMVKLLNRSAHCLGTNLDGSPRHPLYVPKDRKPHLWGSA